MHQDLVDKEAHMRDIVEAKDFRTSQTASIRQWEADKAQRLQKEEEEARKQSVREAMTWIGPAREQDEEYQGKLFDVAEHNVDTWAASTPTVKNWVECSRTHTLLWLHGIPGAGKEGPIPTRTGTGTWRCAQMLTIVCREECHLLSIGGPCKAPELVSSNGILLLQSPWRY